MKRTSKSRTWLIAAALAAAACPGLDLAVAAADDSSDASPEVDEIVVRATRMEKRINDIPASVSVLTEDDIQLGRQQLGLDESLAAVPGLFMLDRYNFAQDLRIAIRGFGARSNFGIRGVKILVDGIPESLPDGQGQSDGIDLGSVRQIEVIRGPASSLYGNASGGVINITTEAGPADPFVESRLSLGDFGFRKYQLKAGGRTERLNYLISLSDMRLEGYRDHSDTEDTLLNARFVYALDDESELSLVVNSTDQPVANDPGAVTLADMQADPTAARRQNVDFDAGESLDQQRLGLSYRRSIGDRHEFRLRNHYVWRDFATKLPFRDGGIVSFDRIIIGGGASYTYTGEVGGRPNNLMVGVDVDRQDDDRQRFGNEMGTQGPLTFDQTEKVNSIGIFVQDEFSWNDAFALTLGLRYDAVRFEIDDQLLGDGDDSGDRTLSELSPMLGVLYSVNESTSVFATVSTAFETPTTTEFANPDGAGGFNPDIDPQTATNYELGIRGTFADLNRYELTVFRINVEGELIPFEISGQPGRDFFVNAGKSRRNGAEFALVSEPFDGLRLSAAYTYSDFEFDEFVDAGGTDFAGRTIPGIPERLFRGEVSYTHSSGLYGAVDLLDVGRLFADNANSSASDSYRVVSLRAGYRAVQTGSWVVAPFFGVNNLTDREYAGNVRINAFGGRFFEAAPDRHYYGGLSIRYNF